ncbi:MAG TPA: hypothetical protein VNO31_21960 [Umezawaea sp.]|nr:hypothetical protein [Umezawaea sp.]
MNAQQRDLGAQLGDDHGLTPEQVDQLRQHRDEINARYPEPDDQASRDAAFEVALRLLRGEPGVVEELAETRAHAKAAAARALAGLQQAALMTVEWNAPPNRHNPNGEGAFARRAGVDRMLVRKWGGKK